ncbi:hypothetical protein ANN_23255 [Periplaneta americana]|uniref:Uncharacterized protein n=1 Tax=Periplaneta americana TaxID=6978 RepID=A0ABQ8SLV1_PERAM|nr:hypothetical protein ANN_23255 [Periplaneta americana]
MAGLYEGGNGSPGLLYEAKLGHIGLQKLEELSHRILKPDYMERQEGRLPEEIPFGSTERVHTCGLARLAAKPGGPGSNLGRGKLPG